ncbi:hypothetical protein ELQ35_06230 [Peribacillus cavernae]|uniref:YhaN AAA domain-containing protein n=1 Tax=Peribacillus cavernae TaxID=1674310 RepID=A0A3S0VDT1_9BACI|nr:AAA family ATPase [Peribacillus cavernae]MDQ0217618.1 uncharacterized protein YhaN [Peribacillus cavernae]RUQ29953.1 hypothetical protein ELQ35_06230 [Peribacillus cavernae]
MKIKELHVYGYGKLENKTFSDLGQLQIFFGENESGKTTIMSFIHSILFGFPTKSQNERRYEPKLNAKYGGSVLLVSERFGEVGIERVKGKAVGDVNVAFENGKVGNENDLKELLQGIDKNYFQSVFSFDLQGLHGVQDISEAALGKYLLSAGMIGSDKLLEVETKLQKQLDARFKPSGQKPELNVKLRQLKDLQSGVKKADEEQRTYIELQLKQKQTEAELLALKETINRNEGTLFYYQEFLRVQPLFEEKQTVQNELAKLGDVPFPVDGLKRLEQLVALKIPNNAQLSAMQQKQQENDTSIEQLNISPYLTANKEKWTAVLDNAPLLEKWEEEKSQLEQTLRTKEREKENYKNNLLIELHDDEISKLDTSIFMTEKIKGLEREKHRLESERTRLDEKYKLEKNSLEATEARIDELKQNQLPNEERRRLERVYSPHSNGNYATLKKEILEEQIAELTQKYSQLSAKAKRNRKRSAITATLLAVISLVTSGYFLIGEQFLLGGITALFAAIAISFHFFINQTDVLADLKQQLAHAEKKKRNDQQQTEEEPSLESVSIRHLLQKEEEIQQQLRAEAVKHKERTAAFHLVIEESERWEASWNKTNEELASIMQKWQIPFNSKDYHAGAALELLMNVKHAIDESLELKKKLARIERNFTQKKQELFTICDELGIFAANWREAVIIVKRALNQHLEQSMLLNKYKQEKRPLEMEIERLQSESAFLSDEMNQLFKAALVEAEEEFRKQARLAEEKERLTTSLQMISVQLEKTTFHSEDFDALSVSKVSRYSVEALEAERKDLFGRQSVLLEQLSDMKHRIRHLEEGGTYSDLLHQYNETKAAFNTEAKEWAKYALAKSMLDKTITTFKRERLPKVIVLAEEYLSFLTSGEYKRILLGETVDGLYLERYDGLRFEAGEVSRGTAEQVYVSLRLALAQNIFGSDGFPIIIDDSFVNFDRNRTANMIRLIQKISESRQVIFFTCHEHLLSYFENAPIIRLGKEKAGIRK